MEQKNFIKIITLQIIIYIFLPSKIQSLENELFSKTNNLNSLDSCDLKLSNNKLSLLKEENLIFNNGILNKNTWSENSQNLYTVDIDNNLNYFYAMHSKNKELEIVKLYFF